MALNVLLTTVGGMTSPDIIKAIREIQDVKIIGTDPFGLAVGKYFVDVFYEMPSSADDCENYLKRILKIIEDEKIDIVVPCGNDDNIFFAKFKKDISCKVMVGDSDSLVNAFNKKNLYSFLNENNPNNAPRFDYVHNYEEFLSAIKKLGYPHKKVVIKPELGIGGRGVFILSEHQSFEEIFSQRSSGEIPLKALDDVLKAEQNFKLLVMEYLGDTFYSVYSLAYKGKHIISLTHIRERGNASQTFRGTVLHNDELEGLAIDVADYYSLSYNFNMELATAEDGRIVLFDLNPRIGASSGLDRNLGVNFPLFSINLALHGKIETLPSVRDIQSQRFIRYFDEIWDNV